MRIIDSSAIAPLLLPEKYSPQAQALMAEAQLNRDEILAPKLLQYEISNALRKAVRQKRISVLSAFERMRTFDTFPITYMDATVHHEALAIALRYDLPAAYDAHYLALAERLGCDFWTADERLINLLGGALAGVRWLGSVAVA